MPSALEHRPFQNTRQPLVWFPGINYNSQGLRSIREVLQMRRAEAVVDACLGRNGPSTIRSIRISVDAIWAIKKGAEWGDPAPGWCGLLL